MQNAIEPVRSTCHLDWRCANATEDSIYPKRIHAGHVEAQGVMGTGHGSMMKGQ